MSLYCTTHVMVATLLTRCAFRLPFFFAFWQALYGVTELVELQFRVQNIRREVHERRSVEKAEDRAEAAAKRRAVSSKVVILMSLAITQQGIFSTCR